MNFRLFQTERVHRHNFKFDENGRKFSKQVENTEGKGEIVHYKQFLISPQCFQKTSIADMLKPGLVRKGLKQKDGIIDTNIYSLNHMYIQCRQHLPLFPHCFCKF